jgi:hypothetical protein
VIIEVSQFAALAVGEAFVIGGIPAVLKLWRQTAQWLSPKNVEP